MPDKPLKTQVQVDPAIQAVEVKITARVEDEDLVLGLLKDRGEEPPAHGLLLRHAEAGPVRRGPRAPRTQDQG